MQEIVFKRAYNNNIAGCSCPKASLESLDEAPTGLVYIGPVLLQDQTGRSLWRQTWHGSDTKLESEQDTN